MNHGTALRARPHAVPPPWPQGTGPPPAARGHGAGHRTGPGSCRPDPAEPRPRGSIPRHPPAPAPARGLRLPQGAPGEGSGTAAPRARQDARGQAPAPAPCPRRGWGLRARPASARPHSPHRPAPPRSRRSSLPCCRARGCPRDRSVSRGGRGPWHSLCRGLSWPLAVCLSVCPPAPRSELPSARTTPGAFIPVREKKTAAAAAAAAARVFVSPSL